MTYFAINPLKAAMPLRLERLKERKIVQWTVAYCVAAWGLVQVVDFLTARFGWPDQLLRILVILAAFGVLAVAVIAWYHGERGDQRVSNREAALLATIAVVAGVTAVAFATNKETSDSTAAAAAESPAAQPEPGTLAVMPFGNLSGNVDEEYFSDGFTEELLNALGAVDGLRVIGRTSSFSFKGKHADARTVGRVLNVAHVVDGSVRRSADRVRISVQLISAHDGFELWSQSFDRQVSDVLVVQQEIAAEIADVLKLELRAVLEPGSMSLRRANPQAYDAYLRGRHHWRRRSRNDLERSLVLFQQSIDADPTFAPAYAGLADTYAMLGGPSWSYKPPKEVLTRAKAAARSALALDSTSVEAHTALGYVATMYDWDNAAAEHSFRRALHLNPDYPTAHHWYALALVHQGRLDEAIAEAQKARELEPLAPTPYGNLARLYYFTGQYERAIEEYRNTLRIPGATTWPYVGIAMVYLAQSKHEAALAELDSVNASFGGLTETVRGMALVGVGERDAAARILSDLVSRSAREYVSPVYLALLQQALRRTTEAFASLERAHTDRAGMLRFIDRDPLFNQLRADTRFRGFRQQLGF